MTTFPDGFLWGASTAGHQVEGGNVNADIWPLEWAKPSLFVEPSLDACDHYHRYPEDIRMLADLGLNVYRFSVEWSRIEPEPGAFSRAALDHYRRMVATCWEHEVTPVVTYSHFTTPRWFADVGGWASPDAPDRFGRYAEQVTAHLGDLVPWALTLNEPNVMTLLQHTGVIPMGAGDGEPGESRMGLLGSSVEQMAAIHRSGVEAIRSGPGDAKVGWTLALSTSSPGTAARNGGARPRPGPSSTGWRCPGTTTWSASRPIPASASAPTASCPLPRARRRCRPVGRCTRRPSATPSAWPPSTPASR